MNILRIWKQVLFIANFQKQLLFLDVNSGENQVALTVGKHLNDIQFLNKIF